MKKIFILIALQVAIISYLQALCSMAETCTNIVDDFGDTNRYSYDLSEGLANLVIQQQ